MAAVTTGTGIPWFPSDYIFACIDNPGDAAAAARALHEAGFHAEQIQLLSGEAALQRIETECEQCNLVQRALRFLWRWTTDEGVVMQDLAEEAHAGHNIVAVHVTAPERARDANRILAAHHAHRVEYWGHHGVLTQLGV